MNEHRVPPLPSPPEGAGTDTATVGTGTNVLRNGNFRRLYAASVASAGGAAVAVVSVSWLVYTETGSAIAITYVGLASIVPGLILGLLAGALADRYNRRRVMVVSDLTRAVLMGGLAVSLYVAGFQLLTVLGVLVVVNAFSALFLPASSAFLPRLIDREGLEAANGLLQGSTQGAQMIGSAAGGAVIAAAGVVPGLAINALTYVVSAACVLSIAVSFGQTPASFGQSGHRPSVLQEIREGLAYMRSHLAVLEVTLGFLPGNLFWSMVTSFTVVYSAAFFAGSAGAYGYLVAALGGGFALGAFLAIRLRPRSHAGLVMCLCVVIQGAAALALAFSHVYVLSIALVLVLGGGAGLINATYASTMQAIVPNRILGRVLSVDLVGSFAGIPAGLILGGFLATDYGIGFSYSIAGLGLLANGAAMLALRDLRQLGYSAHPPPSASGAE